MTNVVYLQKVSFINDWLFSIKNIGEVIMRDKVMNVGESRIPLPRAARPSFFPKGRVLGGTKIGTGRRRSLVLSCLQSVNAEDDISTPIPKCSTRATSTPLSTGNTGNTIFAISPVWDIEENDVQQLVYLSEEKSNFFSLLETTGTLNRIEDVGDSCLRDVNLSSYNDNTSGTPSHYLMLNKQNSFEHDESLGILTPDQMTDFTVALECSRTPSCENLTGSGGSRVALTRASASRPSVDAEPTEEGSSERTPSPEELPLDPKPAEPARGSVVPVSFVTSVTSITSLEAGYQGDGENSRPASRGADPPSVAPPPNLPAPCRQDPMTDSDFFTESDADAHEEIVRGDRKAQVIDGTLFCAPGGRRCPSFTGEEMDSSGIYSDLDKKQDERHVPGEALDENEDHTPDTVDTEVSQRSQPSPVKPEATHVFLDFVQMSPRVLTTLDVSNEAETVLQTAEITVIEVNRANDIPRIKSSNKTESNSLKKYKMPKRNVVSKIKAMIESGPKDEAEKEARRSQRSQRKGSRWDAVMSKIEAGKNEQRTRSLRKEVKSRVLQGLTQSTSPETALQKVADVDNNNSKDNKRRTRGRQTVKSPIQETARSSVRSSMSDLSSAPSKEARKRSPTSGSSPRRIVANGRGGQQGRVNSFQEKKNCSSVATINLEKSPTVSRKQPITRRLTANVPAKQPSQQRQQQQQQQQQQQRATRPTEKDNTNGYAVTRTTNIETCDQAAQTDVPYDVHRAKRAEQIVQALSVTVQYLAYELDAFSTPKLKKNNENMKTEWLAVCSEIDELRAKYITIEERFSTARKDHCRALDQLREDLESRHADQLASLESNLQEERQKCEFRLNNCLNEATKEHRAEIARLRAEHEAELMRKDAETKRRSVVHDQGAALAAEVESLRSVLELKSQENAALRSELDGIRREIEDKDILQQRVEMLEARCEDLKAQLQCKEAMERQISHNNEMLHESMHQVSKQNKRLLQRNEELQWRLRQKNEVVTVLANQLASPRLSRSLGPEHIDHSLSFDKNPQQSSSMIKFVVEKSDSVSWTLDLDEAHTPMNAPPKLLTPEGSLSVPRQGSLRLTPRRTGIDTRARSKSISVTDSARTEDSTWPYTSTPVNARRRPRSDPSSSSTSSSSSSSSTTSSSSTAPANPVVAVAVAAAAAAAAAAEDCNASQTPQEAGGEAMISEETSASSSEDESSTSSDIPRLPMQFAWGKSIN
ncbi:calponin homology domain-containing protein DDB_G0272472-like isoform X4 [Vespa mandarinia]|uniref:calponin homology domain-containing protein DDB_G0272472-like isoform X4 n=2 Tax=Vespa mandarinia TaxID=7446 RepID=UPI00161014AD|nr:calponin homology domain-containing protein DDB_G0272472-like isoform X4 [Vespa mandarinia]